jgi:nucleotide-binding universal stress UspA family protein
VAAAGVLASLLRPLWEGLTLRLGKQAGTKEMIGLLQVGRDQGQPALRRAIETALELGVQDGAAVRHLVAAPSLERERPTPIAIGALAVFERPLPELGEYDTLLAVAR